MGVIESGADEQKYLTWTLYKTA